MGLRTQFTLQSSSLYLFCRTAGATIHLSFRCATQKYTGVQGQPIAFNLDILAVCGILVICKKRVEYVWDEISIRFCRQTPVWYKSKTVVHIFSKNWTALAQSKTYKHIKWHFASYKTYYRIKMCIKGIKTANLSLMNWKKVHCNLAETSITI